MKTRTHRSLLGLVGLAALFAGTSLEATAPAQVSVRREPGDALVVTWQAAEPVDVFAADRPDAGVKQATLVSTNDRDGVVRLSVSGKRTYLILRNSRSGETTRAAERVLPLQAGSNFRDVGGYPAAGGRHVRWGLIFRSGGTPLITERDRATIADLALASMVDLRSDEERQLAPTRIDGVPYAAVGYRMASLGAFGGMEQAYTRMPLSMARQVRQVFARLLRHEVPLAYNCSAGQDRTGFTTALILSALGTPYPTIVEDYHLSTRYRRPEFEMPRIDPALYAGNDVAGLFARMQSDLRYSKAQSLKTADGKPYLDFAFAEMQRQWGGANGYLTREIGLTPADIKRLRMFYTE